MKELLTVDEWEAAARDRLTPMAWDYFRSGADSERTLARNREAFARRALWYRVLRDVENRDLSLELLGDKLATPVLVAPTAYHRLAHPDGERATAEGARAAGALYVISTLATISLEEIAPVAGPRWFQLYVHKDRDLTSALIERAERTGCSAIVLTVDAPLLGRRLADERNGFALPAGMTMANLAVSAPASAAGSGLASYFASRHDASLTWRDLEWLRSHTRLPVLVKGLVRGDDARQAVACGVAGVIVSNHGGRQLDGAPASLDALAEVVAAVGGSTLVLMDGGVRSGTDVLMALALGARAVLVGRPVLWGLAVGGAEGVRRVLALLTEELSRAMALAGCARLSDITPDLVR